MEQLMIQIENMEDVEREIDRAQRKACTSIVEIGFILRKADDSELYRERGYSSIFTFAKEAYGWDKSRTSRFMAINREYSEGGYSAVLKKEYEGFGEAKLSEMLQLPEGIREELDPEMKRDEIRDIKQEYRAAEEEREVREFEEASVAPAQQRPLPSGNLIGSCIKELFSLDEYARRIPVLWEYIKKYREGYAVNEQDVLMAVRPSGSGYTRAGRYMCFFRRNGISVISGTRKEMFRHTDILRALLELSGDAAFDEPESWYRDVFDRELPGEEDKSAQEKPANGESSPGKRHSEKKKKESPEKEAEKAAKSSANGESSPGDRHFEEMEEDEGKPAENEIEAAVEEPANDESSPGDRHFEEMEEDEGKPAENEIEAAVEEPANDESSPGDRHFEEMEENEGKPAKNEIEAAVESSANDESSPGDSDQEVLPEKVDEICQYCNGNKEIESSDRTFKIRITTAGTARIEETMEGAFGIVEFDHCPKCGKTLGQGEAD